MAYGSVTGRHRKQIKKRCGGWVVGEVAFVLPAKLAFTFGYCTLWNMGILPSVVEQDRLSDLICHAVMLLDTAAIIGDCCVELASCCNTILVVRLLHHVFMSEPAAQAATHRGT